MKTIAERLSRFIVDTSYDTLPETVRTEAKVRLMDTIGAVVAGYTGWDYARPLIEASRALGAGDASPVGTLTPSFPPARAAMLNATFAHALELDDGHAYAGAHAGALVIPTALAIGGQLHSDGRAITEAIAVGYEVTYRIAVAGSPALIDRGFHPTAVCGALGAAATAGKLMGLSVEAMTACLGLAGLFTSGLMEATLTGQGSKCAMVGEAAFNGITAAHFAAGGLEGALGVFEGKQGLFTAMAEPIDPDAVCAGLGERYLIADTYNKLYPTCRHAQPGIEAALTLRQRHGFTADEVERVTVGTHRVAFDLTGHIFAPANAGEAKFSLPYALAVALADGEVGPRHLRPECYTDRRYLELAKRVQVVIDPDVQAKYPGRRGAKVTLQLRDGTDHTLELYDLKGSPRNPVSYEDLVAKFRACTAGTLSTAQAEAIIARSAALEDEADIAAFGELLNWKEV